MEIALLATVTAGLVFACAVGLAIVLRKDPRE